MRSVVVLGLMMVLLMTPVVRAAPLARAVVAACPEVAPTGFCIDDPAIQSFFDTHGQVDTFGYPVSRTFTFLGCPVQIFQRQVAQHCDGAPVRLMNILDPEIFPYTRMNGSIFPATDDDLKNSTPQVGTPDYDHILDFVQANAPDQFHGEPVNFGSTFSDQFGLDIWGAPISRPQPDPSNPNFIYQRFQRGIMHYTAGQGTRGVLLADYLKQIMLGPGAPNLPGDLLEQAQGSPLFDQYCPGGTRWLCRPDQMPSSDLSGAFEPGSGPVPVTVTPVPSPITRAEIQGTVNGAKVGTRVFLQDLSGFTSTTGTGGSYVLSDVSFGEHTLAAQDPDNLERSVKVDIQVAAVSIRQDLSLPPEDGGGQLAVLVGRVRGPDKAPVQDALVWRDGAAGLTRSGADGSFQLVLTPRDTNKPKPASTVTVLASSGGRWGFATADFSDTAPATSPQIELKWTGTPPNAPERVADLTKPGFSFPYNTPRDGASYFFTARGPKAVGITFTTGDRVQCDVGACSVNNKAASKSWATVIKLSPGQPFSITSTDPSSPGWGEAQVVRYRT
jgi:hypothetical protein